MKSNLLSVRTMGFGNGIQYECNHVCVYAENIDGHKNKMEKKERKIGPFIFYLFAEFGHLFFPMNEQLRRKMKRPFDALEVNVNSDANTILAP